VQGVAVNQPTGVMHGPRPAVVAISIDSAPLPGKPSAMADPELTPEGNLRLASLPAPGLPCDSGALDRELSELVAGQGGCETAGPLVILLDLPPSDEPASWRCQVGRAVIGSLRPQGSLLVEDYRSLQALSLPHTGSWHELAATHGQLAAHAQAMGWRLRPYWRLALPRERSADGHLVPGCTVSVFLDR
jgi:hypothetical protein